MAADTDTKAELRQVSVGNRKAAELRELSDEDLVIRLREAKAELFNLRVQGATGQLDNNRRLSVIRREIARIYTIMRERELGLSVAPTELTSSGSA